MAKIAVVTGANQGLGFALAEGLAHRLAGEDTVYLTGRNSVRVADALTRISESGAQVRGAVLDVADPGSVDTFARTVHERHGGVDIVFSNAAARLAPGVSWADQVVPFVETNNLGTTRMLRAFSPQLRPGGRLLVVASDFGSLRRLPRHLHHRFDTAAMHLDDVDATMLAWSRAVVEGRAAVEGWPEWINIPSKVGQVAALRVVARQRRERDRRDGTLVAAVCPGLIDTDASRPWFADMRGAQTPIQAADALLPLANDGPPKESFYGELVQFGRVVPWR
jgi:NAD(P)-dependent dehydrogenase (short-subunit alcohol dehydrogenase family)